MGGHGKVLNPAKKPLWWRVAGEEGGQRLGGSLYMGVVVAFFGRLLWLVVYRLNETARKYGHLVTLLC